MGDDEDAVGRQAQVDLDAVGPVEQAGGDSGQGVLDGAGAGRAAVGVEAHAVTVHRAGDRSGRVTWTAGGQTGTKRPQPVPRPASAGRLAG